MRVTHTYVELEVSASTYDEIHCKLLDAGYDHAIDMIDLHGLALVKETPQPGWICPDVKCRHFTYEEVEACLTKRDAWDAARAAHKALSPLS